MTAERVQDIKSFFRKVQIAAARSGHALHKPDPLEDRADFCNRVEDNARDGFVTIEQTGYDCDGHRIHNRHTVRAVLTVVERTMDRICEYADGPCALSLERPTESEVLWVVINRDLDEEYGE